MTKKILKPPPGYSSWLEYAVISMPTRSLFLDQIGDTSHWGRDVQRWEMEAAAQAELEEWRRFHDQDE